MVASSASGSAVMGGWFSSTGPAEGEASAGLGGSQVEQNMLRAITAAASLEGGGFAVSFLGLAWCATGFGGSPPSRYLASTMWFAAIAASEAQAMIMTMGRVQNQRLRKISIAT